MLVKIVVVLKGFIHIVKPFSAMICSIHDARLNAWIGGHSTLVGNTTHLVSPL